MEFRIKIILLENYRARYLETVGRKISLKKYLTIIST